MELVIPDDHPSHHQIRLQLPQTPKSSHLLFSPQSAQSTILGKGSMEGFQTFHNRAPQTLQWLLSMRIHAMTVSTPGFVGPVSA